MAEIGDVEPGKPDADVPEIGAEPASEPEKLVEHSVVPKKRSSKLWYVALIIIVLAAGYYSYSHISSAPAGTSPSTPATGAAASVPETSTPSQKTAEPAPAQVTNEKQAANTTEQNNCSDGNVCTIDFFDTAKGACEHAPIANCCGNNICESNERCATVCEDLNCKVTRSRTACKQDCPLSCPADLVVHKLASQYQDRNVQNPKTFTCGTGACEQLDDADFKLTGPATIKTFITNLGEQSSDPVASQFSCNYEFPQYNEPYATKDGDVLSRLDQELRVRDYFDGSDIKQKSDALSAQPNSDDTATYLFTVQPVNIKYPTTLLCTIWLRSGDFANQQDIKIRYVPST